VIFRKLQKGTCILCGGIFQHDIHCRRYKLTFAGRDYQFEMTVNTQDSMQAITRYWRDFMTLGETLSVEQL